MQAVSAAALIYWCLGGDAAAAAAAGAAAADVFACRTPICKATNTITGMCVFAGDERSNESILDMTLDGRPN